MTSADKAEVPKRTKDFIEIVPDYDGLFQEEQLSSGKRKSKFLSKIFKINGKPILLSLFIYLFQQLPTLIVPLCTAFLVDEVTLLAQTGVVTTHNWIRLGLAVAIGVLVIVINVPSTVLRWKVASKVVRKTSAGVRMAMVRKLQSLSNIILLKQAKKHCFNNIGLHTLFAIFPKNIFLAKQQTHSK